MILAKRCNGVYGMVDEYKHVAQQLERLRCLAFHSGQQLWCAVAFVLADDKHDRCLYVAHIDRHHLAVHKIVASEQGEQQIGIVGQPDLIVCRSPVDTHGLLMANAVYHAQDIEQLSLIQPIVWLHRIAFLADHANSGTIVKIQLQSDWHLAFIASIATDSESRLLETAQKIIHKQKSSKVVMWSKNTNKYRHTEAILED